MQPSEQLRQQLSQLQTHLNQITLPDYPGEPCHILATWGRQQLRYYQPPQSIAAPPLLICLPAWAPHHLLDLQPEYSFIRHCLAAGHAIYVLTWQHAQATDQAVDFFHASVQVTTAAQRIACQHAGKHEMALFGIGQGGVSALLYASSRPRTLSQLILIGTPIDHCTSQDLLGVLARQWLNEPYRWQQPVIAAPALSQLFASLNPHAQYHKRYFELLPHRDEPQMLRQFKALMRYKQNLLSVNRHYLRQYFTCCYAHNALVEQNPWGLSLRDIEVAVTQIVLSQDPAVPTDSADVLASQLCNPYTEIEMASDLLTCFTGTHLVRLVELIDQALSP